MLKNFIQSEELKAYYLNIDKQLPKTQLDYTKQIDVAVKRLSDDLFLRGMDVRKCMIPIDLLATSTTADNSPLIEKTITTEFKGEAFEAGNEERFVVECLSAPTSSWAVQIQGSNKQEKPTVDGDWFDIEFGEILVTEIGLQSILPKVHARWYRCVATPDPDPGSLTFTCFLVETIYDRAIIYATLEMIYNSFSKDAQDIYAVQSARYENLYTRTVDALKIQYDDNDDGKSNDTAQRVEGVTFWR